MTADQVTGDEDDSEGVAAVTETETHIATRSDFWVGLLVLGGTCYGILAAARLMFL